MIIEPRPPEFPGNGGGSAALASSSARPATAPSGVAREFHNLLADLEELIGEAASLTGADIERLKTQLGERVALARNAVGDMGNSIDQQARRTATATNDYVHRQPWNAVGIGVGTGLLLGVLLARRG